MTVDPPYMYAVPQVHKSYVQSAPVAHCKLLISLSLYVRCRFTHHSNGLQRLCITIHTYRVISAGQSSWLHKKANQALES